MSLAAHLPAPVDVLASIALCSSLPNDQHYRVIRGFINRAKAQAALRSERTTDPMERHNLELLARALDKATTLALDAEHASREVGGE